MVRKFSILFIFIIGLQLNVYGQSSSKDRWIGKQVVQRRQHIILSRSGESIIQNIIRTYLVKESNKASLLVQAEGLDGYRTGLEGWIKTEDVISLKESVDFFSREIKLNRSLIWSYKMRCFCYERMGKYKNAMSDANMAIRISPEDNTLFNSRAIIYRDIMDYNSSISDLDTSISMDSDRVILKNRALVYIDVKDYNNSIRDASESIKIDPEYSSPYMVRGMALTGNEEYNKAIIDFNKAIKLDPYFVEAYYQRGRTFSLMNQQDRAIADYKKAVQLDPRHTKAKSELMNIVSR